MSDGRTMWRARDARWYAREWIVILGEDFGPAGPSVIAWLEDEAKLQNDGGRVKSGLRSISRGCFVDAVTVGHVVSRSVTLGLLADYEELGDRFTCLISWFAADQGRAQAATRKARQRAGGPGKPDDPPSLSRSVTVGHGESRSVTECPPTEQDRTEDTSSLRSEVTRRRATRRVDQSKLPDEFPAEHESTVAVVLPILHRCWDARGGVEPGRRGVGLAVLRNPRADHEQVARKLEHWLLAGKGQHARCADVASRFGDWVADESAALRVIDGGQERAPALQRADAWRNAPEYQRGEAS